jgi:hypothetical protein
MCTVNSLPAALDIRSSKSKWSASAVCNEEARQPGPAGTLLTADSWLNDGDLEAPLVSTEAECARFNRQPLLADFSDPVSPVAADSSESGSAGYGRGQA